MIGWQEVLLEEVADELTVGYVGSMASEYVPSGIPFLRSLNIEPLRINKNDLIFITPEFHKRISKSRLSPGDVVIVRTGKPGTCTIIPEWLPEANCSDLIIVRCGKRINNRFLAYYVNTAASSHVAAHLVGAVQQHFNVGSARTLKMNLPPINEQLAIVDVLSALDNKIELNQHMKDTLEVIAHAMFKSWFVDFDPVKAKAEGREPEGMEDSIAALFPSDFTESTLGHIPLGWKVTPLADICENIFSGGTPSTQIANYWNGGIPWLSSGETRDRFIIGTEKTITEEGVANSSTRLARHGCTVIAGAGQGHTRGQTSLLMLDSYINQSVVALKANPEISSDFFLFFDLTRRYEEFRQLSDSHSSRGSLTTKLLSGVRVVLPPAELIQIFDDVARPVVAKIIANLHNSRTLGNLRDIMLPRLISGELRVDEISELAEAVAL